MFCSRVPAHHGVSTRTRARARLPVLVTASGPVSRLAAAAASSSKYKKLNRGNDVELAISQHSMSVHLPSAAFKRCSVEDQDQKNFVQIIYLKIVITTEHTQMQFSKRSLINKIHFYILPLKQYLPTPNALK